MSTGIVVIVVFLVVVFALGFPTRKRIERAYLPKEGPHPIVRPFRAAARALRERKKRARRRKLKSL